MGIGQVAGLADLERDVRSVKVAAMSVANFLHVLDDGALVIVPVTAPTCWSPAWPRRSRRSSPCRPP